LTQTISIVDEALIGALAQRGFIPMHVATGAEARDLVLAQLPDNALVAHGGSTTLQQIGVVDALREATNIRYGNAQWMAEEDPVRRLAIRKQVSIQADVFLGSVQAVTRSGRVIGADQSGSRQAFYVYGPSKVIWVVSVSKIVADLDEAMARLHDVVMPLEDARVKASGASAGTAANKIVVFEGEPVPGRTTIILVDESLGF
jgi:L-lactate utilization protein LutC